MTTQDLFCDFLSLVVVFMFCCKQLYNDVNDNEKKEEGKRSKVFVEVLLALPKLNIIIINDQSFVYF